MTGYVPKATNGYVLSDQEIAILRCLADGLTAKETATKLHIAVSTVQNLRYLIYGALDARNGAHAAAIAVKAGLI